MGHPGRRESGLHFTYRVAAGRAIHGVAGHVPYCTVFLEQYRYACDWKAWLEMQKTVVDEKKVRGQLKSRRDLLLEEYSKNPMNTRLAIEIKLIDDQIAELTEHLVEQRKSGQE